MSLKIKKSVLKVRQLLCLQEAVRYGSISKAAEKNSMKQSNLSVHIKSLEEDMGESLITRVHDGVRLTEAGNEIYSLSCDLTNILTKVNNANIKAFRIAGAIRLWTSDGLGVGYLSRCFPDFYLSYPNVNIEIICSLEMPKIDQFDMAVLYEKPESPRLYIVDEHNLEFGLFASRTYLEKYGYPKNLKDIELNHRICTRANYSSVWKEWGDMLSHATHVTAMTNSSSMLLQLVKDGIGIGLLPVGTAEYDSELIYLSKIKIDFKHKIWVVVRDEIKEVDKIKALLQFIENESEKL